MCIMWILSVSAKGLHFTATVLLENCFSCLINQNHEIGLLRAWETLSKIYHICAARSNHADDVKWTEWRLNEQSWMSATTTQEYIAT